MPTVNYYIEPQDGWVQVADSPKFVRTTGVPHTQPYYLYAGSSAPSLVPTAGHGVVTFSTGVPTTGQTITVGTETYTFKALAAAPFEVTIGATNIITAQNFLAVVNSTSTLVEASGASNIITLTSLAYGSASNYSLSKTATNVSVSGTAFTGGTDIAAGVLFVSHHPFVVNVTMAEKLFARVVNPQSDGKKFRLDVFTIS